MVNSQVWVVLLGLYKKKGIRPGISSQREWLLNWAM